VSATRRNPSEEFLLITPFAIAATLARTMEESLQRISTYDDLRAFVHRILCDRENILQDQFGLTEIRLTRNGTTCGMQFCLHGPRSVRLEAIWVENRNLLYFYDARGARFLKLQLRQRLGASQGAARSEPGGARS
jgi:hypothetical protein